MEKLEKMRVVLDNGTHRDFKVDGVFTNSDIRSLLGDVLLFVKLHGQEKGNKIHSWFPVYGNEKSNESVAIWLSTINGNNIKYWKHSKADAS